jgi:hypothetical protein
VALQQPDNLGSGELSSLIPLSELSFILDRVGYSWPDQVTGASAHQQVRNGLSSRVEAKKGDPFRGRNQIGRQPGRQH